MEAAPAPGQPHVDAPRLRRSPRGGHAGDQGAGGRDGGAGRLRRRRRPAGADRGGDDDTPPHWNVTFATDDVEATAALATELGAEVLVGPVDAPWVRMAVIRDPQGATFIASQFVPENAAPG